MDVTYYVYLSVLLSAATCKYNYDISHFVLSGNLDSYENWKNVFGKTGENIFGNARSGFGQLSENLKISRNLKRMILNKFREKKLENCQEILGEFSESFNFCHVIKYVLFELLVAYSEILSLQFLRTDLASLART